ncbi:hypothetical protein ACLB2K_041817 [Fragaria x ananassa]
MAFDLHLTSFGHGLGLLSHTGSTYKVYEEADLSALEPGPPQTLTKFRYWSFGLPLPHPHHFLNLFSLNSVYSAFLHPVTMAFIDAITANFAGSLALASSGAALDLGIGGCPRHHSSQSFLLGRPVIRRTVVDPN